MKRSQIAIACGLMMWLAGIVALPGSAEIIFSTGLRYDVFRNDLAPDKDSGAEITLPFGAAYTRNTMAFTLESGYSQAMMHPGNEDVARLSSLTDTLLSVSYSYNFAARPLSLFIRTDLNLPTGKERLNETEQLAEAGDRNDLFEVDNFGDGLNLGTTVGLIHDVGQFSLGLQGAYVYQGVYDPTSDIPDDDFDPGDQIIAALLAGWQPSQQITVRTFLAYSRFLNDTVNNQTSFRAGDQVALGTDIHYARGPIGVTASVQATAQGKDDVIVQGALQQESRNSNGNMAFALLDLTYATSPRLTWRILGDIRYYGESELNQSGLPFQGRRIRYAAGPGFLYALNDHLSINGLLKFHLMRKEPDVTSDQTLTYHGLNADVSLTYRL